MPSRPRTSITNAVCVSKSRVIFSETIPRNLYHCFKDILFFGGEIWLYMPACGYNVVIMRFKYDFKGYVDLLEYFTVMYEHKLPLRCSNSELFNVRKLETLTSVTMYR